MHPLPSSYVPVIGYDFGKCKTPTCLKYSLHHARRNTLGFLLYVPCQRYMSMDAQVLHPQLLTLAVMASGAWLTLALGLGGNAVALITLGSQVRACA